jgi:hypothetical protein
MSGFTSSNNPFQMNAPKNDNIQNQQSSLFNFNNKTKNNENNTINNIFTTPSQSSNPLKNNLPFKKEDNPFSSLFFSNNQKKDNLNNNIKKEENKNISIINTDQNINTNNINNVDDNVNFFNISKKKIGSTIIKKEEKKEQRNIFLDQSNNILNKMNNDINTNKNNEKNKINLNNKEESRANFLLDDVSQIINNSEKKEDKKIDEFIKNLFEEDNLVCSDKQMKEYQKNKLSTQTGEEILNDLKSALYSQKEQFLYYTKYTRMIEEKFYEICKKSKEVSENGLQIKNKINTLSSKENQISENTKLLEENIFKKNKNISEALDYLLKNSNANNNIDYLRREDFENHISFFNELKETSNKVRNIEDDLNIISNNMDKSAQNLNDKEKIFYDNYTNRKNVSNNELYSFNDNTDEGVWIERNNIENKVYVTQKEMNEIFNDCYSGLNSLIGEQDEIDKKCDKLKRKLLEKINKKNKNLGNYSQNINNKYNINNP